MLDEQNFLAIANFNDSGDSGRGKGKNQNGKTDWYETVRELLELSQDTAVTLEAVGISESNARNVFGTGSDYEVATLSGIRTVHKRIEDKIVFGGKNYKRDQKGKRVTWSES